MHEVVYIDKMLIGPSEIPSSGRNENIGVTAVTAEPGST